jgi:hypothetical protein
MGEIRMQRWLKLWTVTAAGALLPAACGSTATLVGRRQPEVEARINWSSETDLCVTRVDGARYAIPRAELADIRHPGRVLSVVGMAYLATGMLFMGTWAAMGGPDGDGAQAAALTGGMGVIGLTVGTPLLLWGGTNYLRSRRAAAASPANVQRPCSP